MFENWLSYPEKYWLLFCAFIQAFSLEYFNFNSCTEWGVKVNSLSQFFDESNAVPIDLCHWIWCLLLQNLSFHIMKLAFIWANFPCIELYLYFHWHQITFLSTLFQYAFSELNGTTVLNFLALSLEENNFVE